MRDLSCWRTVHPHTPMRKKVSGRHPGTPPPPTHPLYPLGMFQITDSCHSRQHLVQGEMKVEPFKDREAAVNHWFQGEAGAQFWGPGSPGHVRRHTVKTEFKLPLVAQWQGHSSGLTMKHSQDTCKLILSLLEVENKFERYGTNLFSTCNAHHKSLHRGWKLFHVLSRNNITWLLSALQWCKC